MPFCKTCGTFYPKSMGICPKCNAEQILQEQPEGVRPLEMTEEELKEKRKRGWIGICIGVPGLIALLYVIGLVMKVLGKN